MATPDATRLLELHERLLSGDPTASAEIAEAVLDPLTVAVTRRNPRIQDPALIADAVSDAVIDYFKKPALFDAAKSGLFGYLKMAAQGDLQNALAKVSRRRAKEIAHGEVEVLPAGGKKKGEDLDPVTGLEAKRIRAQLPQLFEDPRDLEMVELIIDQERSTESYSAILDISELPLDQQRREVKRHKDRLKKRLRELGETIRDDGK